MTNEVVLRGRLSRSPEERVLPSGDSLQVVRVVVARPDGARAGVDWVDCAAWSARLRRTVSRWRADDEVEVHGALRRRFYRTPAGASTLIEVELSGARLIRRAPSA